MNPLLLSMLVTILILVVASGLLFLWYMIKVWLYSDMRGEIHRAMVNRSSILMQFVRCRTLHRLLYYRCKWDSVNLWHILMTLWHPRLFSSMAKGIQIRIDWEYLQKIADLEDSIQSDADEMKIKEC